jgi:hypothetical protein
VRKLSVVAWLVARIRHILEHYAKCNATPQHTRDWAAQHIRDRDARRKGRDSVKEMESAVVPDGMDVSAHRLSAWDHGSGPDDGRQ